MAETERVKLLGSLTYFLSFSKTICTIGLMNETSGLTRRQIEINLFSQQLSTITRCHLYLVARLLDESCYICKVWGLNLVIWENRFDWGLGHGRSHGSRGLADHMCSASSSRFTDQTICCMTCMLVTFRRIRKTFSTTLILKHFVFWNDGQFLTANLQVTESQINKNTFSRPDLLLNIYVLSMLVLKTPPLKSR